MPLGDRFRLGEGFGSRHTDGPPSLVAEEKHQGVLQAVLADRQMWFTTEKLVANPERAVVAKRD